MARVAKYSVGATGNMTNHYERKIKEDGTYVKFGNKEIDLERTHLNYNLAPDRDITQGEFIKQRMSEVHHHKRADLNVMCSWVVTLPKEHQGDTVAEKAFFEQTYDFLKNRYGEKNVISAYVHMDETTPHLHFAFVPVVPDKKYGEKISAKELLTKKELQIFHTELDKHLNEKLPEYDFKIMNEATKEGNKEIVELKRETAMKEIKKLEHEVADVREKTALNIEDVYREAREHIDHVKTYEDTANALERFKPPKTTNLPLGKVAIDKADFEKMTKYVKGAIVKNKKVNALEKAISDREVVADQREEKLKAREDDFEMRVVRLDNKEKNLNQKEQKLTEKETQVNELHQSNLTIHQRYNELLQLAKGADKKLKETAEIIVRQQNEIKSLKQQIAEFPQKLAEAVEPLKERILQAWTSCKAVVQAVGFLRHDEGDYKANLTDKQARLIDAVSNYARDWAEHDGFPEIAKEIDTKISISKGVQNHIDDLMPKQQQRQARGNDFELG